MLDDLTLRQPAPDMLPEYTAALRTGWSPSTTRDISGEQLAAIAADEAAFLASLQGDQPGTITLPDGQVVPRVPGPVFWIWDGAFCGQINLRHQPGTLDLPPQVSGHIGYAVVPWKRRQGIATKALRLMLPLARARGLPRVLITCDEDNLPSRRVIEAAGGVFSGRERAEEHGGVMKLLFWVATG